LLNFNVIKGYANQHVVQLWSKTTVQLSADPADSHQICPCVREKHTPVRRTCILPGRRGEGGNYPQSTFLTERNNHKRTNMNPRFIGHILFSVKQEWFTGRKHFLLYLIWNIVSKASWLDSISKFRDVLLIAKTSTMPSYEFKTYKTMDVIIQSRILFSLFSRYSSLKSSLWQHPVKLCN